MKCYIFSLVSTWILFSCSLIDVIHAGERTPYTCVSCNRCYNDWSAEVDWLYWTTRKSALNYAVPVSPSEMMGPNYIGPGDFKFVNPNYDSGVRVSLYKICNQWHFGGRYLFYSSNVKDSLDANFTYQGTRLHPNNWSGIGDQLFAFAESTYNVNLHILDIEALRTFIPFCNTLLTFFGGIELAFIDQSLKTIYSDLPIEMARVKEKIDMDAYGVYVGTKAAQRICGNLGVFGRLSIGALLGKFDRVFFEDILTIPEPTINIRNDFAAELNHFEIAAGLEYVFCSFKRVAWNFRVGYELHSWLGMSDFINFVSSAGFGGITGNIAHTARDKDTLGFDGLFVSLKATF